MTRDDPSAFAPPAQFGPFRVLHQIGVGALGPVFRTYEPERDRLIAVKVFRLDITPEQAQALADELSRAGEAGLFHPSIVEPIAAGVERSVAYNAEEYVAAESLDVALRHYAPAAAATVLPFITQLAGAIDFARVAGVGHGALHPRDIFLTPEEARATGFGVVEALERVGLRAPVRRPYSPPERIAGGAWSTEADVFSLAAIAYELLTGRRPAGLGAEIGAIPGSEPLHAALARAMDEEPSRRYPTALAFASALESAVRTAVAVPPSQPLTGPRDGSRLGPPAAAAPAATLAKAPFPESAAGPAAPDGLLDAGIEGDDVAAERDEDDAHHRLAEEELEIAAAQAEIVEHGSEPGMEEDSEIEAEADRYAGDDFLLDAAGAASAPQLSALGGFDDEKVPADRRALEDDEFMVDEPPTALFQPADLRHQAEDLEREKRRPSADMHPRTEPHVSAHKPAAPTFGHYEGAGDQLPPSESRSRLPLALMLVLGLLVGFIGGYAVWGRATGPAGREWSEQTVGDDTSMKGGTERGTASGASGAATGAAPGGRGGSASPGPADAAPAAGADSTSPSTPSGREGGGDAPASPATGGAAPPAKPVPRPATGTLVVRSSPTGAGVTINGRWRGRTPLTLDDLPFARHDVRIVQPGYTPAREAIALSADEPARSLTVRLEQSARAARGRSATPPPAARSSPQKYTGAVYVDSRPRGARVFIDGKPVGVTPLSVAEVPIGSHVVRLELPDHRIWSTTARVTAGQQSRVTGSLERIQ